MEYITYILEEKLDIDQNIGNLVVWRAEREGADEVLSNVSAEGNISNQACGVSAHWIVDSHRVVEF